jgi:YfiH family protein
MAYTLPARASLPESISAYDMGMLQCKYELSGLSTSQTSPEGGILSEQRHDGVRYTQFELYQQFSALQHGVFMRTGGQSAPPYHGLNTIKRGEDTGENVVRNRQLALQALDLAHLPAVTLWQVHEADVITYQPHETWRTDWANMSYYDRAWTQAEARKGDALITHERGVSMALSFADCVPITFYDPIQHVIGIAHGGWRGTARGIVVATVEAMYEQFGSQAADVHVGIGPAIGPCCYEVSEQVQRIFMGQDAFPVHPTAERHRDIVRTSASFAVQDLGDKQSLRLDLQETNRQQLLQAGLSANHIEIMRTCTSCNTDRYFSHRAEQGQTGRFAVVIALKPV